MAQPCIAPVTNQPIKYHTWGYSPNPQSLNLVAHHLFFLALSIYASAAQILSIGTRQSIPMAVLTAGLDFPRDYVGQRIQKARKSGVSPRNPRFFCSIA